MSDSPLSGPSRRATWWDAPIQDLRYAIRGLRAKKGFTLAVVITLGFGIGANATIFSIVDRLLFRPPPMLRDAATTHRMYLTTAFRGKDFTGNTIPYARYVDFSNWTTSFTRFAQYTAGDQAIGSAVPMRARCVWER